MTIITGKTPLSLTSVVAILSLSLVVNLPGLAITPMLENIKEIFPDSTEMETQLLTMLPNVLIIPFMLIAGKLSMSRHKIAIVAAGLLIFTGCAVAYLLSDTMTGLILISCVMGAGAGILVPFSTGLIADSFDGVYKMKEMGLQSGIANMTLVAATFIVGFMDGNWHLPFTVYLVSLIPLALTPFLRKIPQADAGDRTARQAFEDSVAVTQPEIQAETEVTQPEPLEPPKARFGRNGFSAGRTAGVFSIYFGVTFLVIIISYYCPFLAHQYGWAESFTGTVTSLFFLFVFLPGFFLPVIVQTFRSATVTVCAAMVSGGLALMAFIPNEWVVAVGAVMCGLGYGCIQPLMYDKATRVVDDPRKSTLALAVILSANYLAIVLTPIVCDAVRDLTDMHNRNTFPFEMNFVLSLVFILLVVIFRRKFSLEIPSTYYRSGKRQASDLKDKVKGVASEIASDIVSKVK